LRVLQEKNKKSAGLKIFLKIAAPELVAVLKIAFATLFFCRNRGI